MTISNDLTRDQTWHHNLWKSGSVNTHNFRKETIFLTHILDSNECITIDQQSTSRLWTDCLIHNCALTYSSSKRWVQANHVKHFEHVYGKSLYTNLFIIYCYCIIHLHIILSVLTAEWSHAHQQRGVNWLIIFAFKVKCLACVAMFCLEFCLVPFVISPYTLHVSDDLQAKYNICNLCNNLDIS